MKLIKTLPALFAIALLGGCANSQCSEDTTEGQEAKAGCCSGEKTEGAKSCCDGEKSQAKSEATTETKPAQKN